MTNPFNMADFDVFSFVVPQLQELKKNLQLLPREAAMLARSSGS